MWRQDLQTWFRTHESPWLSHREAGLNHSAILSPKIWLTPAIVTTGRDLSTIRPAYGLLVWRQDLQPGFEPTSHHGYLTEKLALTTRPSCPLKCWSMPAIVTTGRSRETKLQYHPPSLWTSCVGTRFCNLVSNPRVTMAISQRSWP